MTQPLVFSGSPLDRAFRQRRDRAWLDEQLESEDSRFLPFWRLNVLVKTSTPRGLGWGRSEMRENKARNSEIVLLGIGDGVAHFALDVSGLEKPESELGLTGLARFEEVRTVAAQLSPEECAIVAHGRALIDWHARHRFCAVCGSKTAATQGGLVRECDDCDAEHFPRTDPVVIMLVSAEDSCLLGRQTGWPEGMYSALAGFIDQGETIEEAVRREVSEESGVRVGPVRYFASQPWPFPSSLMIGCLAEAETREISVDKWELQDARWFTRAEVTKALREPEGGGLHVPPAMSMAHQLIRAWAEEPE
jgi:NAD+ diphosphatase